LHYLAEGLVVGQAGGVGGVFLGVLEGGVRRYPGGDVVAEALGRLGLKYIASWLTKA
jgi:hypothetical protein